MQDDSAVRLYHLDEEGGAATILYGSLGQALRVAAEQPVEVQSGLFLQTGDDVIAYTDLVGG